MSNRRFGVEIELTLDVAYDGDRDENYCCADCDGGDTSTEDVDAMLARSGFSSWGNTIWDGSMFEIRSPILDGVTGFDELRRVMEFLKENGGHCTDEDGLHVHFDSPEYINNADMILRLIDSWVANEKHIESFVDPGRIDSWCCAKTFDRVEAANLKERAKNPEWDHYYSYERGALNVDALQRHGSIELRLHEGTLDYRRAESWIKFGQRLIDHVALSPRAMRGSDTASNFLDRLSLDPQFRVPLLERAG